MNNLNSPFIDIMAGARPNFMKLAPIIRTTDARLTAGSLMKYRLVHTGQRIAKILERIFCGDR